ncbi:hypothetical protein scyTo_0018351 [Scyliorhinus torazame]|uniref:Ig-like domain-containing protein n=1 Tax=Scyliorhinus torazame TaxID=75743 RepID=A0A401PTV0_SCYTO|nr:hypothetical protein [Scyliorhinus torazame]
MSRADVCVIYISVRKCISLNNRKIQPLNAEEKELQQKPRRVSNFFQIKVDIPSECRIYPITSEDEDEDCHCPHKDSAKEVICPWEIEAAQGMSQGVTINSVHVKYDAEADENIREGSKITLTCSASILKQQMEALQIVYLFYKGEEKGVLLKNVTSDERETQCIIQSARVSHSGYYHCVVEAGSEKKKSESIFITVKGKLQTPLLSIQPMNVTVGDSIVLRCASEEIPPLLFIFFKEKGQKSQRLKDVNSNNKSAVHQLKVIANTDKNYSCKVRFVLELQHQSQWPGFWLAHCSSVPAPSIPTNKAQTSHRSVFINWT